MAAYRGQPEKGGRQDIDKLIDKGYTLIGLDNQESVYDYKGKTRLF